MYEPLRIATDHGCTSENEYQRLVTFNDFISCNFTRVNAHSKKLKKKDFDHGNFPFRNKHRRLCSPPFCWHNLAGDPAACWDGCPDVDLPIAEKVCRAKVPVMKSIRVCDLALVKQSMARLDLRILLLVRDPRGIYNSRRSLMKQLTLEERTNNIKWTCRHMVENNAFMMKLPQGLQNKILTIKYEDIAMEPLKHAKQILDFSGLTITNEISDWVKESTSATSGGTYSVHRNATESGEYY